MKKPDLREWLRFAVLTGALGLLVHVWNTWDNPAGASPAPKTPSAQELDQYSGGGDLSALHHLGSHRTEPMTSDPNQPTNASISWKKASKYPTGKQLLTENSCENINTVSAVTLQRVRGIGRVKAQAIIDYRNQFGPFKSLDELARVKGIGPATVENFRRAGFCVRESGDQNDEPVQTPSDDNPGKDDSNCDDINTADAAALQRVSRIGRVKAKAIVDHRDRFGPFKSLDELARVRGIGPATLKNFREAGFCVPESVGKRDQSSSQTQAPSNTSTTTNCNNVNTANAATLQRINRIGPVKSQAIIDYRNQFGPFKSLDELVRVKGIGPATLENFRRANFCVQTSTSSNDRSDGQSEIFSDDSTITDNICEDINRVDANALHRVRGIGPVRSMDALLDVKGMNPDIFDSLKEPGFCVTSSHIGADSTGNTISSDTAYISDDLPTNRSLYGGWLDVDEDCQNTRHEILIARSRIEPKLDEMKCIVISGEWDDPYTGETVTDPGELDIDHFIPLAEAQRSGGAAWSDSMRYSFGNDLSEDGVLLPVSASENRAKGDRDPSRWLPPNESYRCQYVERWVSLKRTWRLTMDYCERRAVEKFQAQCTSGTELPELDSESPSGTATDRTC